MGTFLQFVVLGLGLGSIYIGLGTGLLLVHRATGIINFAQGAMAMWGAYVFAQLRVDGRLVFPIGSIEFARRPTVAVAAVIGLVTAFVLGLVVHYLVFRPVRNAPVLAQVVVSVAVMITLQALVVLRFGANNIDVASILPEGTIHVLDVDLPTREIIMAAIMVVLAAAVWAYLRFTRAGVATRAASENERAAVLMGFSPDRLAAVAQVVAVMIGTISVMLGSSLTGLNPDNYTLLVVPALAVLLVARMESIGVVVVAALLLGAFQSVIGLLVTKSWWPVWAQSGLDQVIPFAVVMVILFVQGKRLPSRGSLQTLRLPDVAIPKLKPIPAVILLVLGVAALSLTTGTYRFGVTTSIIVMLLALSYVVITGYLGQISLAQGAFAGAAGFCLSKVTTEWGVPFPLSLILCALVATALGMLVALPAFRIRGAQLAIITIAAALAIERFVFNNYTLTPPEGNPIADATLLGLNLGVREGRDLSRMAFSLMVLVVAAILVWVFIRVASGDTGRTFLAVRANERAAASSGINVRKTKLIGFAISAFIAGIAGCLIGFSRGQLSAESFTVFAGLQVLAVAYLGGITSVGGAIVAGVLGPLGIVYVLLRGVFDLGEYYPLISGLGLILTAILNPVGIAGATREQVDWVRSKLRRGPAAGPSAETGSAAPRKEPSRV
ncbi:ABC transporter permease [Pseudonocardia sp. RS11V-5]|uniref:ABC transporter permease n=1 Tax=Pseudonocardia terrae TaxID=2905831 RepID=UPI001E30BBE9|nr:ABC transporter permease [Pseudonocardia terrae]MCE3554864.1 ABC transporter permease [Pseudonocardia terrae]